MTMGHEVCGVVAEVGARIDERWRGARVVTETFFSTCGTARYCREGSMNVCAERRSIGRSSTAASRRGWCSRRATCTASRKGSTDPSRA